ncbi:MAG TPA: FAD-dependent oxidoreductase, partial [Thermodesulfobacteriota bacterium]|nr:FAD-dependent oxidoreductase [Thermodesulfobacteriota bacterium]
MYGNDRIGRREAIKLAGLGLLTAALSGSCASRTAIIEKPPVKPYRDFPLVEVSRERIVRQAVGLRPFRPSGFVVRYERLGDKDIVHNYGHGGGGLTLSWGTSHLAVEKALPLGHRSSAVIGCGAVGLATARLLQFKGMTVTIYAKDLPPDTTSNVAAGQWSPFTVFDENNITTEFFNEFIRASRLSYSYYRKLIGPQYGVSVAENFYFGDYPVELPDAIGELPELYGELTTLVPGQYPFKEPSCVVVKTMLIDSPTYLNTMMSEFRKDGGRIVQRNFADTNELLTLNEPLIMNCTGLGSYFLFGDRELEPVKGQLIVLIPQPEIDYITLAKNSGIYMIPRSDGIMLGGSRDYGNWSMAPDPEVTERIFTKQSEFWNL